MAFEKRVTVQQLFLKAILKTYYQLVTEEVLKPALSYMKKDQLYTEMISGEKSLVDVMEEAEQAMLDHEECLDHDKTMNTVDKNL